MTSANFYQILGVSRSASADQIKSAHRDLVKRYHPDLFSTAAEKNQATEKLRLINEAYAVLGNAERRRRYDAEFIQEQVRPGASSGDQRSRPERRSHRPEVRSKTQKPKLRLAFSRKWAGCALAAVLLILFFLYVGRSESRLVLAWVLWEKTEVLLPKGRPSSEETGQWVRLRQYGSVEECAAMLRKLVRDDEQAGGKAVLDEKNGTMAIVVHLTKDEEPRSSTPESGATVPTAEVTKRVRNLECRVTQRLDADSRLRRTLRSIGLS